MKKLLTISIFVILLLTNHSAFSQPISDTDYAISEFQRQIKETKLDKSAYMGLIMVYYKSGQYDKAFNTIDKVNTLFKKDQGLLASMNNYAMESAKTGNYEIAEKFARKALSMFGDDPDTVFIYANILKQEQKYDCCAAFLEDYLQKDPGNILLIHMLIETKLLQTCFTQAFDTAQKFHRKNMQEPSFYFLEGLSLQGMDSNKAIPYYEAYLNSLSYNYDLEERIEAAKAILKVIKNDNVKAMDYLNLINTLKKKNAPKAYILIQIFDGCKKFPEDGRLAEIRDKLL